MALGKLTVDVLRDDASKVKDAGPSINGMYFYKIGTEDIDGVSVDVIQAPGSGRYYWIDGKKVPYVSKNKIKEIVAQKNANDAKNKEKEEQERIEEQRQQAQEEIEAEKEYQQGKREEYEQKQGEWDKYFNSVWGEGGQPTIGGFTKIAMDSANAYAKQQAKQQAQDVAQQAAHGASNQAMQAAVNAGMSPAQAALMGGQSSTAFNNAYGSTYQNTFNNQQQSYLGKQTEEIGLAQQQQNRADQNYNTATQNIYQQNNRQDDYLGVAQQERDYYNNLSQQELQKQLQYYQNQINAAQTAIKTISGLIQGAASLV